MINESTCEQCVVWAVGWAQKRFLGTFFENFNPIPSSTITWTKYSNDFSHMFPKMWRRIFFFKTTGGFKVDTIPPTSRKKKKQNVKCPYKEEDASVVIFNATWTRNPIGLNNTKELKPKFWTSWCIENDSSWQPANNRPQLADANERENPKGSSSQPKLCWRI